jgi:hypothetical protein
MNWAGTGKLRQLGSEDPHSLKIVGARPVQDPGSEKRNLGHRRSLMRFLFRRYGYPVKGGDSHGIATAAYH